MAFQHQIEKLQSKPYQTRVRILWVTVAVIALGLILLWVFNLKHTLTKVDSGSILNNPIVASAETEQSLISVERVEKSSTSLKIYFNVTNPTSDILNFSTLENISLKTGDSSIQPRLLTDRQNKLFIQKALSKTQNFGVLTFDPVDSDEATLVFDQMFFEKTAEKLLKQTLNLDLNQLQNNGKPRS